MSRGEGEGRRSRGWGAEERDGGGGGRRGGEFVSVEWESDVIYEG